MTNNVKEKKNASTIDARLLAKLRRIGGFKNDQEALEAAAQEFIDLRAPEGPHAGLIELFGKIDYFPDHDIKQMRRRKVVEDIG